MKSFFAKIRLPELANIFLQSYYKHKMGVFRGKKIFIYMENASITIKDDYLMIMYNPVLEKYDYQMYHVLDICEIEGKKMVNIQYRDENDHLSRVVMTHEKFIALVITKILIPLL